MGHVEVTSHEFEIKIIDNLTKKTYTVYCSLHLTLNGDNLKLEIK